MPLVAKHQTSKAALISCERMAFCSDAYLILGIVLSNKLAVTGDLKPWLHIQLFPSMLVHISPTSRRRTRFNGSCTGIDDGHNQMSCCRRLRKLRVEMAILNVHRLVHCMESGI